MERKTPRRKIQMVKSVAFFASPNTDFRHCQVICTRESVWHDRDMKIPDDLFKNHRFPAEIIQYAVWLYFVFPSVFAMSNYCYTNVGSWSAMKLFVHDAINLVRTLLNKSVVSAARRRINGIWMRCLSRSRDSVITCGEPSIERGRYWIS